MTTAADTNAAGKRWTSGPYVRKDERELWNDLYDAFINELHELRRYPVNAQYDNEQMATIAWNLTYLAIWELRNHGD